MLESSAIINSPLPQASASTNVATRQMGKNDFLKLLTVQLQHQDPLSPMESQDMASQIAQFSQVEQLEQMASNMAESNKLELMLTQAITNTMSTTLVGKNAKVHGDSVIINDNKTGQVSFSLPKSASTVKITILDEKGDTVKTIEKSGIVSGNHTIDWDGKDKNGDYLSEDREYHFKVEANDSDGKKIEVTNYMIGTVTGVRYEQDGTFLILNSGQKAPFSSVIEILANDQNTTNHSISSSEKTIAG